MDHRYAMLEYRIKKLYESDVFRDKEAIVFGANGYAENIIHNLRRNGIIVNIIFDNNQQKQGMYINGAVIMAPTAREKCADSKVVIASSYFVAMEGQLIKLGYEKEDIINLFEYMEKSRCDLLDTDYFNDQLAMCVRGEEIKEKILCQKSKSAHIYLAPVPSIGDIYLLCLYFKEYLIENIIEDYVLAIPGNSGCRLAEAFGYKDIVKVTEDEAQALMKYRLLMGSHDSNVFVMHSGYLHIRIPCYLLMYRKRTWMDNYRDVLFHIKRDYKNKPVFESVPLSYWEKLKREYGFVKGKTVVLSPYARTLADLPVLFWERLSQELADRGYIVYTNVLPGEEEVKDTGRLEAPLEYAAEIIGEAGIFIGLRSGFCDVVSSVPCRKIILYTKEIFETVKVIDFYSLNRMGLCNDAVEFEVSYNIEDDVEKVLVSI